MTQKKWLWKLYVSMVAIIVVITYTPLTIAEDQTDPFFMTLPYTLWITILFTIVLVVLTWLGGKSLPDDTEDEL